MESKVVYYENNNSANTQTTFQLVLERLQKGGIKKLVIASTTGNTARQAMEFFHDTDVQLVVIPHQHDFKRKENTFPQELVEMLRNNGHAVHFSTMLFHTEGLYGNNTPTIIANLLRCFSQGVKVCFEIVLMATDGGLLTSGEQVIAIAGTGRGADTAMVMQAASSQNTRKLRVNEILCKPLNPLNIDELKEELPRERLAYE